MMFVGSKYLFLFHMPLVNDFMLKLVNEIGKLNKNSLIIALDSPYDYLKYDGEKVNGYILDDNIDLKNVKKNGTFLTVTYNFDEDYKIIGNNYYVCEVEFDGLDYSINKLAFQNQGDNIYKIENKSATKDEVEAYIENWKNNTKQVEWCLIDE